MYTYGVLCKARRLDCQIVFFHSNYQSKLQMPLSRTFTEMDTGDISYIYCYVYSLPPCYFTQSALPNYQTGCCSVCYTCDLSRVTGFARCRLFVQLGRTFALSSRDR